MGIKLSPMEVKNFRASWLKTLTRPILFSLFFLWLIYDDEGLSSLYQYLVAFWGVAIVRVVYIFMRRGVETYQLDADGFSISRWQGKVPWAYVDRVLTYPTPLDTYICFMLKDGQQPKSNLPWPSGLLDKLNSELDRGEVWLSTSNYGDTHDDMLNATFDAFCAAVPDAVREEKECRAPTGHEEGSPNNA